MSSRNVYLDREQRAEAPVLQASLQAARHSWMQGERDPRVLGRVVREILETSHLLRPIMSTCVVPNPFSRGQNSVKAPH